MIKNLNIELFEHMLFYEKDVAAASSFNTLNFQHEVFKKILFRITTL